MNAEREMATGDGLGAASTNAERLRRLRELIDEESPIDGIHNPHVLELFGAAERECICAEQDTEGHADGCPMAEPLPECPRFLACTSEGSGESSYRDNPDYFAGDRDEVGEWIAGSYGEGWACNWVVDLDTGQGVSWTTRAQLVDESSTGDTSVHVVEVAERDGTYLFAADRDARRFYDAVKKGGGDPYGFETEVDGGEAAERLIAAERGDALESKGWPSVAEDVREGTPLERCLTGLREIGEGDSDAAELIQEWLALDLD